MDRVAVIHDELVDAADEKATIDAGRRAQRLVDAQAEQVADLQRAINTLEAAEKADQVEVGDD